eukprot:m51a1_g13635 hypothetical protein (238) ;mRNA; f:590-1720
MHASAAVVALLVCAASAAPALVWSSTNPSNATTVTLARIDVPALATALASGTAVTETGLTRFSLTKGNALFLFVESGLVSSVLATRAALTTSAMAQSVTAVGVSSADLSALSALATSKSFKYTYLANDAQVAEAVKSLTIDTTAINVFAVNAKPSYVADLEGAATKASVTYTVIYTASPDTPVHTFEVPAETTIWTGPFLAFLFSASILITIAFWGVCLNLSMQSQGEIEAPKVKTL